MLKAHRDAQRCCKRILSGNAVVVVLQPPLEGSLYGSRGPGRRISSSRRNSRMVLKHGILQRYVVFASKTASMSGGEVISPRICRAGTRDRRPGRSRTPAGSGSSWVCRSPATTSRRPVFRGRLQRRRTYGSLIATDEGPEPQRPAIRHRSPEAVEFVKSNAPEQTGEPAGEANQFAPAAGRA